MTKQIDGIVLAAGASSRMGSPKPLLEVADTTFLERAIHMLREAGCRYVVAVVDDNDWVERLADVSGAAVIINDDRNSEQIQSLRLGLANLPEDSDGAVVLPVDYPRIQTATVRTLIEKFGSTDAPILNPSYNGEAGHPVLFAGRLYPELLAGNLPDGARTVIEAHQSEARTIAVDDEGVLIDVDTRADYDKHIR
ncbi:MAG TPA: nucleotidyltransferase family protein [Longimicrobiales bacterium]|nr:nucleotidyltransferase family protein [Longimicrobiales bacterium]